MIMKNWDKLKKNKKHSQGITWFQIKRSTLEKQDYRVVILALALNENHLEKIFKD